MIARRRTRKPASAQSLMVLGEEFKTSRIIRGLPLQSSADGSYLWAGQSWSRLAPSPIAVEWDYVRRPRPASVSALLVHVCIGGGACRQRRRSAQEASVRGSAKHRAGARRWHPVAGGQVRPTRCSIVARQGLYFGAHAVDDRHHREACVWNSTVDDIMRVPRHLGDLGLPRWPLADRCRRPWRSWRRRSGTSPSSRLSFSQRVVRPPCGSNCCPAFSSVCRRPS